MVVARVTAVFGVATLGMMSVVVFAGVKGVQRLTSPVLERFAHAGAGLVLTACGLAVKFGLQDSPSHAACSFFADFR